MKTNRLPAAIVMTSWLATLVLTVVWVACPSRRLLDAQQPASPTTAAGAPSANLNPTVGSTARSLASQVDPNLQVLTLGPVHEAFGQPVLFNPGPNPIIPNKPPAPVEEIPPSMKPAGNDVEWIPGYWSWDATQQKFVWTSGIWRVMPPGLAWVPGYWTHSGIAYQWVSGYWRRSETATALASFTKQLGVNSPGNLATGSLTAPSNPTAATVPTNAPNAVAAPPIASTPTPAAAPTVPSPGPTANPSPGVAPNLPANPAAFPDRLATLAGAAPTPGAVPGSAPGANPVPGAASNLPANPAAFPDPLAALAGDAPTPGAIPGPATAANPVPGLTPDPTAGPAGFATTASNASPGDPSIANAAPPNPAGTSAAGAPFVPQPPGSLESGPVGSPPTPDSTWIPGTWIYRHGRFLWLAGQWAPIHRGWVWTPARYVWTPAGYVFVDGYWDYELAHRGTLFAPVSFRRGYHGWGFSYTPNVVLNTDLLTDCLFVNSPCGCYCFGDYYGANCAQAGIFPWFAFHMSSLGYDPCFAFCSWAHHKDAGWHEKLIGDFRALRDDARLRPPHTFDDLANQAHRSGAKFESLALPLGKFVARTGPSSIRFENLSAAEHGEIQRSLHGWHEAANRRLKLETKSARHEPNHAGAKPADVYLHNPRGGNVADNRVESKIADRSKLSKQARQKLLETSSASAGKQLAETSGTQSNRTPPVVARRPVSTAGLNPGGIRETPDQRLANPKFVPQASNRGRSEPAQKASAGRHR
jgi:hypothetical protein